MQRLSLTNEQAAAVEKIFRATRASEESFTSEGHPGGEEFERERQRLRDQEDQEILKLLKAEQKTEFKKMVKNRRNPPPRR